MLSLHLPLAGGDAVAPDDGFAPNALIRIGSGGQGLLTMPCVEMGQGTYTSIPMLIAEELEVRIARMTHLPVAGTRFLLRVSLRRSSRSPIGRVYLGQLTSPDGAGLGWDVPGADFDIANERWPEPRAHLLLG